MKHKLKKFTNIVLSNMVFLVITSVVAYEYLRYIFKTFDLLVMILVIIYAGTGYFVFVYSNNEVNKKLYKMQNISKFLSYLTYHSQFHQTDVDVVTNSLKRIEKDDFYNGVLKIYSQDLSRKENRDHLLKLEDDILYKMYIEQFFINLYDSGESMQEKQKNLNAIQLQYHDDYKNLRLLYRTKRDVKSNAIFGSAIIYTVIAVFVSTIGEDYLILASTRLFYYGLILFFLSMTGSIYLITKQLLKNDFIQGGNND